jgi:signal transduction histidine kinase
MEIMCIMVEQFSLRAKVFLLLGCLSTVALTSVLLTTWMNYRTGLAITSQLHNQLAALDVARDMETSLAMLSVSFDKYLVDGQSSSLKGLEEQRRKFGSLLKQARETSSVGDVRGVLNEIESKHVRYSYMQDRLIELRKVGQGGLETMGDQELNSHLLAMLELCEQYKRMNEQGLFQVRAEVESQHKTVNLLTLAAVPLIVMLSLALFYLITRHVLDPIRELALLTHPKDRPERVSDEVKALSHHVHSLIEDVDQTQSQLQISREHLLQSGKLAMVGKLAAGVAHSVRNPLTSVKMRMFSLGRSLKLSADQKEDFDVISDEIRHIDNILQNFLEFSRPPKLKMQKISPSDVVDGAIQLLRHRIESYGVTVELYRKRKLPEIEGDPEQLKEVVANLMINACEAMTDGGTITVQEEAGFTEPMGRVVAIKIGDNGPGIPESIHDQVFQPFYSTKEEGTGLGLSIAVRIIEDHQGCLNLRSRRGKGATFTITIPCKEAEAWLRS